MAAEAAPPVLRNRAGARPTFVGECRAIAARGHLLSNLVGRDLTVRYKRSVLGFLWTMLNPLLLMLILMAVFSAFFRFAIEHYEVYFLSEYLVWNFFAQTTVAAMTSLGWNGALMKRVRVQNAIFAVSCAVSGLVNLLLSCVPLVAIMLVVGAPVRPALLFLPVAFLINGVFALGLSLALSAVTVYFADVKEMYQVGLMGLMYLTPMFYPLSIVPQRYLWVLRANPLLYLFETVRAPIYHGVLPAAGTLAIASALAVAALGIGWLVFRRLSPGFYLHV